MKMHFSVNTSKSFDKAIEDLKKNLSSNSFGILWELNFKES